MSSLKMTFSLASLVLILGLVFATAPVMAQEDEPVTLVGITLTSTGAAAAADAAERFTVISAIAIDGVDTTPVNGIPDLEERFLTGTTIALLAPAAKQRDGITDINGPADAVQAKDVVISEIMWALNTNALSFAMHSEQQWIELYNTTLKSSAKGAIDTISITVNMADWILYFVDTHDTIPKPVEDKVGAIEKVKNVVMLDLVLPGETPVVKEPYILVDIVSNLAGGGWNVVTDAGTYGNSGKIKRNADDTTAAVDLVSTFRKITYDNVTKDHAKDKLADNRKAQTDAIPGGGGSGSWAKSTRAFDTNLIGTPGKRHFKGSVSLVSKSSVDRTKVIVNEIGNSSVENEDWVEFRNVSGDAYNLRNHHLSHVKAKGDEATLVNFKNVDVWIPKDGVLLVLASDPDNSGHPIAGGINVKAKGITWDGSDKAYEIDDDVYDRKGSQSLYYIDAANGNGFDIPTGDTLIILRNADDKLGTDANLLDVNGGLSEEDRAASHATNLWPLKKTGGAHGNTIDGGGGRAFKEGFVWQKNTAGGGTGEKHWAKRGFTGIGYKRDVDADDENGGTPGYGNGSEKVFDKKTTHADYKAPPVTISEVMYDSGGGRLPQWIELSNSSLTDAVQISEWQLKFENADDVPMRTPAVTVKLSARIILPNQTLLIVSANGRVSGADHFPDNRVANVWDDGLADGEKDDLEIDSGITRRNFKFMSETAFKVTLMDKADVVVDTVGNMGADPAWDLPTIAEGEDGRSSLIRRYTEGAVGDGTVIGGWGLASESLLVGAPEDTYYGGRDDQGTPGFRAGGPLPVSLSKFRPERLDSGAVVIRWITESELNNAGFNILRSETRDGEFTKLNTNLIAGQGTISERTVYEYADISAKPNVVYYYQIQDVSLDGKVQTLRQSRIKGDISADGKITTIWAEIKTLHE